MEDKEQIIIDGVDVSKCSRLIVNKLYGYVCNCEEDEHLISSCKNRPNCHFKQLQRKTAECEELKKNNQILCDLYKNVDSCLQKRTEKFDCYRKALEPFEDEYFKGLDTKQIAELAKKSIRLTTENRKLENKLSDIAGICEQILDGEDYVRRIAKTILDIINKAKEGNND